jgi:hypothetical protein
MPFGNIYRFPFYFCWWGGRLQTTTSCNITIDLKVVVVVWLSPWKIFTGRKWHLVVYRWPSLLDYLLRIPKKRTVEPPAEKFSLSCVGREQQGSTASALSQITNVFKKKKRIEALLYFYFGAAWSTFLLCSFFRSPRKRTKGDEYLDETELVHSRHVFTSGMPWRNGISKSLFQTGLPTVPSTNNSQKASIIKISFLVKMYNKCLDQTKWCQSKKEALDIFMYKKSVKISKSR